MIRPAGHAARAGAAGAQGRPCARRTRTTPITWTITPALTAHANYDESMRTPSPIEIECARSEAPCALPNDFTGDPLLKPVVAHTLSGGLSGAPAGGSLH